MDRSVGIVSRTVTADGQGDRVCIVGLTAASWLAVILIEAVFPVGESVVHAFQGSDWLMPFAVLLIDPAEELLFRGVVQSRLEESFATPVTIVGAALLFAGIHVPAYEPAQCPNTSGSSPHRRRLGVDRRRVREN